MLLFSCGQYTVRASIGALPLMYSNFVEHAVLNEDFGSRSGDGTALFFAVDNGSRHWPELVVALRFEPGPQAALIQDFC